MNDFVLDNLVRTNIKNMRGYSSARDEFKSTDIDMIFLDANENPFENGVNRYPDPLQTIVKKRLSTIKGLAANNMLLGNGSDEVLDLIFRVFCYPEKDNIITLPPTYGMYNVLAETNAVENREVPLNEDFQPDVNAILEAADENTKLLFLCSPNNPTANLLESESIVALLTNFKGIVVIDEAYIDYSSKSSWLKRLEAFPNLIVIQTLSKAYGLAGIRLGLCFASTAIIALLNKIKPPYNVNELTQRRALERLENFEQVQLEIRKTLEEKTRLLKELKNLAFVKQVFDSDTNFILLRVDDANRRYQQLLDHGIVVRNRSTQLHCENCLRFTVGTTLENDQLLNVLYKLT